MKARIARVYCDVDGTAFEVVPLSPVNETIGCTPSAMAALTHAWAACRVLRLRITAAFHGTRSRATVRFSRVNSGLENIAEPLSLIPTVRLAVATAGVAVSAQAQVSAVKNLVSL